MSTFRSCDYCGLPITDDRYATVDVQFAHVPDMHLNATVGDYHFTRQRPCYQAMTDAVLLAHEFGGALEHKDVATGHKIGALRRKHTTPPLLPPALPDDDGPDAGTREVAAR